MGVLEDGLKGGEWVCLSGREGGLAGGLKY